MKQPAQSARGVEASSFVVTPVSGNLAARAGYVRPSISELLSRKGRYGKLIELGLNALDRGFKSDEAL